MDISATPIISLQPYTKISTQFSSQYLFTHYQHLETLNLSGNGIEGIDFGCIAQITRSSKLKNLILGQNRIEGSGLKGFAAIILSSHECPLTHLSLRQNALCGSRSLKTFDPEPVILIARSLSDDSNRTLTSLDLSCCDIGARAAEKLMEAMKYNDTITALDISNCNITSMGGVAVGDALPFVKQLQILHLKENCLGAVGCKVRSTTFVGYTHVFSCVYIFVHTSSHPPSFTISKFSALNFNLFNYVSSSILQALFQGLARNISLTWLDISSNYLTGMEVNMNIEFDSTSMEEISDSIGSNTTLEYLDLSDNRCEYFIMPFLLCCQLLALVLDDCHPSTRISLNSFNPVFYHRSYPQLYPHSIPLPFPSPFPPP